MRRTNTFNVPSDPTPCPCALEGRATAGCWQRAYTEGQADLIAEFMSVLVREFERHEPDHDCRVCRVMKAMADKNPHLADIPRLIQEGLWLLLNDPEERAKIKRTIELADRLDEEGR